MNLVLPLAVGCVMIAFLVGIQAIATTAIVFLVERETAPATLPLGWFRSVNVFARALLLILIAQLLNIAVWAALFFAIGDFSDFATAFYHSTVNFTTLGYGDVLMSPEWRLLGGLEAVAGMLMFGISTALLFSVIDTLLRVRDRTVPKNRR